LAGLSTTAAADDRQDCAQGSPEVRIAACTRILNSNPEDFNALANRGIAYRVNGEYDRALVDANAAMHLNPGTAGLYLERGLAYAGKGYHRLSIADLSEAIRRDGSLVVAHFGRAMAYEAMGELDRADADLDKAVLLDRNLVAALYIQRGYAARAARDYDKAISAFDRAIELNARWLIAYYGRGAAYEDRGDIERAVDDYRKVLEFDAKTAVEQQRQQQAREQLDKLSRG
jgi:tetratricopeptide (TPR) repeat protein